MLLPQGGISMTDPKVVSVSPLSTFDSRLAPGSTAEVKNVWLDFAATFDGLEHGDLVGEFEFGADGNAHADSRHLHAQGLEKFGKVNGRAFAFHRGAGGNDEFLDLAGFQPLDQVLELQLLGTDALQRREEAMET